MPDSQQYLYLIQPTRPAMLADGPTPQEDETISRHFDYLKALTDQGIVILAGRTLNIDESSFGIVIFKAECEEVAHAIMNNDPAVQAGLTLAPARSAGVRARLFPYRIALMAMTGE
jgi:uncharacterized protein YciI